MHIVILPRGWVVVGKLKEGKDFSELTFCAVIRRWGSTRGLGEIAENGPTKDTILDNTPPMRFPNSAIINMIACDATKWKVLTKK